MRKREYKDFSQQISSNLELLDFDITINGSEWNKIKPTPKFDKDRIDESLNEPWTNIINQKIWEARKLSCAFTFKKQKFYKSFGFPYFVFLVTAMIKTVFKKLRVWLIPTKFSVVPATMFSIKY